VRDFLLAFEPQLIATRQARLLYTWPCTSQAKGRFCLLSESFLLTVTGCGPARRWSR
jgi:hypothetical protein